MHIQDTQAIACKNQLCRSNLLERSLNQKDDPGFHSPEAMDKHLCELYYSVPYNNPHKDTDFSSNGQLVLNFNWWCIGGDFVACNVS